MLKYKLNHLIRKFRTPILSLMAIIFFNTFAVAQNQNQPVKSSLSDPMVLMLVIVMLILLLAIGLLGFVVIGAAHFYRDQEKKQAESTSVTPVATLLIAFLMLGSSSFAQDNAGVQQSISAAAGFGSLSTTAFYCLVAVLLLEVVVLFYLLFQLKGFIAKRREKLEVKVAKEKSIHPAVKIWDKLNSFRPKEKEADMDLGHDYDGIRELDNGLPPWWLYGFYVTIIVSVIYLWRYHVSHSAPSSEEEFTIAMQQAAEQKEAYLKKSANNVDETTIKLITEPSALTAGKSVFDINCGACHGKLGEGGVGPNLTDEYWLHGGSIADVFKSIKYGWADKGMKSWKDDLSPVQMAQIASYIKSLQGTNPPNAKEKQGDQYIEQKAIESSAVSIK